MPIRRQFFDWKQPALAAAADYLWQRYSQDGNWNLDRVIVALPGSRARRRLLELLVGRAEERRAVLVPPQIVTVGQLPELLYELKKPLADDLTQQFTWVAALAQISSAQAERLVKQLPPDDDLAGWLAMAKRLARVHRELAADGLDFSHILAHGEALADFRETDRWQAIAALQRKYLQILDSLGLWDNQTARLYAIEHRECRTDRDIVLVGTVDMDQSQRAMLDQVALDQVADRVTALIFGPHEQMAEFDEHGCLAINAWREMPVAVDRKQIAVVDGPAEQADAVLAALAAWNDTLAADEVTVGAADESVVPYLEQRLVEGGLAARFGAGTPLARSGPLQLVDLLADYLESGQYAELAALARHPDVGAWLAGQGVADNYLASLDRYFGEQLPAQIDPDRVSDSRHGRDTTTVSRRLAALVAPLAGKARPLGDWAEAILQVLADVYGHRQLDRSVEADRAVLEVCRHVSECAEMFRSLDSRLMRPADGAAALRLVVERIGSERLPPPAQAGAIEVLGWLELPLDDAAGLVVTGVNEGIVPSVGNADLFLPDRLRSALGLEDNDRRYARDNYALNLLAASRRLKVIAGRRGLDGEPLVPSRLLFACEGIEMAKRAREYFAPAGQKVPHVELAGALRAGRTVSDFPIPRPVPLAKPVVSLRVTELRDYLACPYRYYLRHILKLESLADEAEELAADVFGTLLHAVLKQFADDERLANATDPAALEAGLNKILDRVLAERFGSGVLAAVRLQGEQIRQRLAAFARWQAGWRAEGWRIHSSEVAITVEDEISLPGAEHGLANGAAPIYLRGRIDRVDVHEVTGQTIVFDYKTGDKGETPERAHREKQADWIDLQLPLYRHLLRAVGIDGPMRLGYILLPKDTSKVGAQFAEWDEATLADADAKALEVIRAIGAEKFWPPTTDLKRTRWFSEFAAICQEDLLLVHAAADDDDGEEETP